MTHQERYKISTSATPVIKEGHFFKEINKKHLDTYKAEGAAIIVDNVRSTYRELQKQLLTLENHNSLLVGKVQSGKTSNLELLAALAFDNGYNVLVIFGGYDTDLLKQCTERFGSTFDAASGDDLLMRETPVVFTTNETTDRSISIDSLDVDLARRIINENRPIIITSLKRPPALKKTIKCLAELKEDIKNINTFIIDDEGDQASLNVAKNKKNNATATYKTISKMKDVLANPLYLSVTATPEANIFQSSYSVLKPASIHLIKPGNGYDGASVFHLAENDIIVTVDTPSPDCIHPDSLTEALYYFWIASAIKQKRNISVKVDYSDMIVHSDRTIIEHNKLYSSICDLRDNIQHAVLTGDTGFYLKNFEKAYNKYLSDKFLDSYPFSGLIDTLWDVVNSTGVILQNSKGKLTKTKEQYKLHKIYVGGDLLQRGLTFKYLIVSYFTRFAKKGGNMDTTLQRARWFGYRDKYLDLCKIFTTDLISQEFSNLAEIEDDLWDQFEDVESGKIAIDDILISAENTTLVPTAKNKAKLKKIDFKHRWITQKFIVTDEGQIKKNNEYLEKLIDEVDNWETTTEGSSNVPHVTAQYSEFSNAQLVNLVKSINSAFDREPLYRNPLLDTIGDSGAIVILMWDQDKKSRYRSIYNNSDQDRIKALHQGANTTIVEKQTYLGDKKVIIDPDKINIQIHYVSPGFSKTKSLNKDQYMFAIYLPKNKVYFVKDED